MVLMMDDENRENEGDLIIAADVTTAEHITFFARHACGLVDARGAVVRDDVRQNTIHRPGHGPPDGGHHGLPAGVPRRAGE